MVEPILASTSTWFSQGGTAITRKSITEIEIVDSYTPTGNETASWDASANLDGSVMAYVTGTKLTLAGNGTGCIYANPKSGFAFSAQSFDVDASGNRDYFENVTAINGLAFLNMSRVTSMTAMFFFMKKLASFTGVAEWDVSNVTSLNSTWCGCTSLVSLTEVRNWNTSKVTTISAMLQGAGSNLSDMIIEEVDIGDWDVSNVVTANHAFYGCAKLRRLDLNKWNTTNFFDINHMFADCNGLEELKISNWDVSNCQLYYAAFNDCRKLTTLDLSSWNTNSARTFAQMFERCSSLTKVIGIENFVTTTLDFNIPAVDKSGNILLDEDGNPEKWSELFEMFYDCSSLTEIDLSSFDTRNVHNTVRMFKNCQKLKTVYVSDLWSMESVTASTDMFSNCTSIVGEEGTVYSVDNIDATCAVIDGGENAPGYFTHIQNVDDEVLVKSKSLYRTGKAIRTALGNTEKYRPSEMPGAISSLTKGDVPEGTPVAKIGDVEYCSLDEAISIASENATADATVTVQLVADYETDGDIVVAPYVVLDTYSHNITAKSIVGLIGSSLTNTNVRFTGANLDEAGRINVAKENLKLSETTVPPSATSNMRVMPFWLPDSSCYTLTNMRIAEASGLIFELTDDSVTLKYFRNSGPSGLNTIIANDGPTEHGVKIGVRTEWVSNGSTYTNDCVFSDANVKSTTASSSVWYTYELNGIASVLGADISTFKITPIITTDCGAIYYGVTRTYTE